MVRATSIEAYRTTDDERLRQRDRVVIAMGDVVWTRRELAEHLGLQASSMSGRVNELIKEGRVEETDYKTTCEISGKRVRGIKRKGK